MNLTFDTSRHSRSVTVPLSALRSVKDAVSNEVLPVVRHPFFSKAPSSLNSIKYSGVTKPAKASSPAPPAAKTLSSAALYCWYTSVAAASASSSDAKIAVGVGVDAGGSAGVHAESAIAPSRQVSVPAAERRSIRFVAPDPSLVMATE